MKTQEVRQINSSAKQSSLLVLVVMLMVLVIIGFGWLMSQQVRMNSQINYLIDNQKSEVIENNDLFYPEDQAGDDMHMVNESMPAKQIDTQGSMSGIDNILGELVENISGFSQPLPTVISWNLGWNESMGDFVSVEVKGKKISIITTDMLDIDNVLSNNGFTMDQYNVADGTVTGLTGYSKDGSICIVAVKTIATELEIQNSNFEDLATEYVVSCGEM